VRIYDWSGDTAWIQLGLDIDGEAASDQSGHSVSLSADGSRVVIGAYLNDGTGSGAGHVRIYDWSGDTAWIQLGLDIDGEAASDQSGYSVSLSSDGSRVAIGAHTNDGNGSNAGHVRVFELPCFDKFATIDTTVCFGQSVLGYTTSGTHRDTFATAGCDSIRTLNLTVLPLDSIHEAVSICQGTLYNGYGATGFYTDTYTNANGCDSIRTLNLTVYNSSAVTSLISQIGLDIDGETAGDYSGNSVSLSSDGNRVAIGARYNDGNGSAAGHVRIYEFTNCGWVQLGLDIDGEASGDNSGWSVSLSSDGSHVAIGATQNDGNGSNAGHVRIYQWNGTAWVQLGLDIDGEDANDNSGYSVSISSDGSHVAIGAVFNDGTGSGTGQVRIYQWSGTAWVQLGLDIDGEASDDWSGWSVSLSSDGSRVAIGAYRNDGAGSNAGHVRIYDWSGSAWVQLGLDIDAEAGGDRSGYSVSLSSDGSRVAIGAPYNAGAGSNAGHVRVYQWNGTAWVQLGVDIDGEATDDYSGWSVSLSSDGSRVAIGAYRNDGAGTDAGHVRVFELPCFDKFATIDTAVCFGQSVLGYTTTGTYIDTFATAGCDSIRTLNLTVYNNSAVTSLITQIGLDIDGEAVNDWSGYSVSLSSDGNRVAIGARYNVGNGSNAGHVRIYEFTNCGWVQLGLDINGEAAADYSGWSVSLSSDGSRVAIGAPYNNGNGSDAGHVRIYDWSGTAWVQLGSDIDGEAVGDYSGNSVSLSSDGSLVAIGAYGNDGTGSTAGHVRIYNWSGDTAWIQLGLDIDGEVANDASGNSVSLSADGSRVAIGARNNAGNGTAAGHVRIYNWNGSAWVQLGVDIEGEAVDDYSGYSVCLSSDGSRVAIGAYRNDGNGSEAGHVRIYDWNGTAWVQLGSDIEGEAPDDQSGNSVSLSSDGSRVAIGANRNDGSGLNAGHVRIYDWSGDTAWVQLGLDIDGETADDNSGCSVSISSDGSRVAIGARFNDGNGSNAGHVRVFELPCFNDFTIDSTVCFGQSVLGYTTSGTHRDTFATTGCDSIRTLNLTVLALDSTHEVVSICQGTMYNGYDSTGFYMDTYTNANGCDSIRTLNLTVYNNTGITSLITQIGLDIDGEAAVDVSGYSVSLSSDGSRVAIGAPNNDGNGSQAGHVRIYDWSGTAWVQLGLDIDGEAADDLSGWSVSLSSDGSRVSIGAPFNDGNGSNAGHVRVFELPCFNDFTSDSTVCFGQSVSGYSSTGTYIDTFATAGCDSIRTLNLTVLQLDSIGINASSCDPLQVGSVTDTFTNTSGCDSLVTTVTTLLTSYTDTLQLTSCDSAYTLIDSLTTTSGCDSVTVSVYSLLASYNDTIYTTSCLAASTTYDSLSTVEGCDSITTTITIFEYSPIHWVTSISDNGTGSLREAVEFACDGDSILFDASVNGDTIQLDSQIMLDKNLIIIGNGVVNTIISGQQMTRIFMIPLGDTVFMEGMLIKNGYVGDLGTSDNGGGIWNAGHFTLSLSRVSGCFADDLGGGVYNSGDFTMINSEISGNRSDNAGGGICGDADNSKIINCTIAGNSSSYVGGYLILDLTEMTNTIVANNENGDVSIDNGYLIDGGYNLIGNSSGLSFFLDSTTLSGTNSNPLDPLFVEDVDFGSIPNCSGNLRLSCASPAINAGSPDISSLNIGTLDLDSAPRVFNSIVDIGGYEFQFDNTSYNDTIYTTSCLAASTVVDSSSTVGGCDSIVTVITVLLTACDSSDYFITTWKTDNPGTSGDSSITIPT
ncbi:MAG: hypothetical protein GY751_03620, partial [Bacteroidetes bacterium]|nr:hypothetical protein [Bacteroidota bacterium]